LCLGCRQERRSRPCLNCGAVFRASTLDAKYCARACYVAAVKNEQVSTLCAEDGCERPRRLGKSPRCSPCDDKRRDPERKRANWRARNHLRRTQYRAAFDRVTPEFENALRAKARKCPLCSTRMTDDPLKPNSKELDHIVPRNAGGTHTIGNVRIICRSCNVRRPKDGSDYVGPVTLWATA